MSLTLCTTYSFLEHFEVLIPDFKTFEIYMRVGVCMGVMIGI